jgi:hypothetical protein
MSRSGHGESRLRQGRILMATRFFISRATKDSHWVPIVAQALIELGHIPYSQDGDFKSAVDFVEAMKVGASLDCTIALYSDNYFASEGCCLELNAALAKDLSGKRGRLLPIMISECEVPDLISSRLYINLTGMDQSSARARLLEVLPARILKILDRDGGRSGEIEADELVAGADPIVIFSRPDNKSAKKIGRSAEGQDDRFRDSIRDHMKKFEKIVERLTADQLDVLDRLGSTSRIRISGVAGSGKTLVAAEKAIRSSRDNRSTLLLCHSPLLAENLRQLTAGSQVVVRDFGSWIDEILGLPPRTPTEHWTSYQEPALDLVEKAFDQILASRIKYDSIVIDEGQDFRLEWWMLVEAALGGPETGSLFIFHDDNQCVLSHRCAYPFLGPTYRLSRNCRNGGMIYSLVSAFDTSAPNADRRLKSHGSARIFHFRRSDAADQIVAALEWMESVGADITPQAPRDRFVALHMGTSTLDHSPLIGDHVLGRIDWQFAVVEQFRRAIQKAGSLKPPPGKFKWIVKMLGELSGDHQPSAADVELVRAVAGQFTIDSGTARLLQGRPGDRLGMTWDYVGGSLQLTKHSSFAMYASELIIHLQRPDWSASLPSNKTITLQTPSKCVGNKAIPIFSVSDYKGLESDAAILVVEGVPPAIEQEMYVGISRARRILAVLVDPNAAQFSSNKLPIDVDIAITKGV